MKIIKHGKYKETVVRFECSNCGCVFEEKAENCNQFIACGDTGWIAKCPECHLGVTSDKEAKE